MSQADTSDEKRDSGIGGHVDPLRWVDDHGDVLFSYAYLQIRDRDVVEDLVQETLLAGLTSKERYQGESSIRTWLIGILRHKIVDHLRATAKTLISEHERADNSPYKCSGRLKAWPSDPATIVENREFWVVFNNCTEKLPPKLADVFYMREVADMEAEEICRELKISESNFGVRMFRARAALRHCLDTIWFSTEDR
ncbi:MAG: RNA polymerase sigma-70 factor (ECF subfamily) [Pirellulaceae bacterium]|jgi:RNA polymerase sigma-70 factor (ECF subfamily)